MASRKRSTTVFSEPEYSKIDHGRKDYGYRLWQLDFFCGQEKTGKQLKADTLSYLKKAGWKKSSLDKVSSVSDGFFSLVGKYCLAMNNGAQLAENHINKVIELIEMRLGQKTEIVEEKPKPKRTTDIQSAMWAQIEPIVNELDSAIDNRDYKVDVYRLLVSNENAKAAQVRQIKSYFANERKMIEVSDGEEYPQYTAAQLRKLVKFLNDIEVACDTVINSQKQQRTPRKKKATPATQIVKNVKFSEKNVELGLVSINPVDILQCSLVWYYNEKKRKLGFFQTDEFNTAISFKNTSIIGFGTSGEKTVRNPETLKGFQKLSKAKMLKFYNDLTTKESTPSPRTSEDMIFLKKL